MTISCRRTQAFGLAVALATLAASLDAQVIHTTDMAGDDLGARINACVAALPPTGGTCDARGEGGAQRTSRTIALSDRGAIALHLAPSLVLACAPTAAPCMTFGSNVRITGHAGEWGGMLGTVVRAINGQASVLASATPEEDVSFLVVEGVTFWNADSTVAPVVDLRNVSHAHFLNVAVEKSLGPAALIRTHSDPGRRAYYNMMSNVRLHGGLAGRERPCDVPASCRGIGYEITNRANDFRVFGGAISSVETALYIAGTGNEYVTGVSFYDVSVENYRSYLFHLPSQVYDVRWFGGRLESAQGEIFAVGPRVRDIMVLGALVTSGHTWGTDGGVVLWMGETPTGSSETTFLRLAPTSFDALGSPPDGTLRYCRDCRVGSRCEAGGRGAIATRLDGRWRCN